MNNGNKFDFSDMVAAVSRYAENNSEIDLSDERFIDWFGVDLGDSDISARDIYQACLNRLPEADVCRIRYSSGRERAQHISQVINSEEFRRIFLGLLCKSYPEAKRVFFLHIPKTGGTDLRERFRGDASTLIWDVSHESDVHGAQLAHQQFAKFHRAESKRVLFSGHYDINDLLSRSCLRASDKAFTVIRNPVDVVVSAINFVFTELERFPERPYAQNWSARLAMLGVERKSEDQVWERWQISKLLRSPDFYEEYANLISRYLGGRDGTLDSVVDNIVVADMDLVEISALESYVERYVGPRMGASYLNVSKKVIQSEDDLDLRDRIYIRDVMCSRDMNIFDFLKSFFLSGNGVISPSICFA
ncbi:sulfotransferase family 2 domain-containing protein [Burkholderia cepacia]|nr:sulfotransferase family 2 domain-containing protein [Burkholderia cepacia]